MSMAKLESLIPVALLSKPLTRAKRLAETMACVLNDEDVSDVAIAIALLMSAVVNHYADDPANVTELVNTIRELEDRLLAKAFDVGGLTRQ